MDFYKVPIGFGMALAANHRALSAYSALTEEQRKVVLQKAHNARSQQEMDQIVSGIAE